MAAEIWPRSSNIFSKLNVTVYPFSWMDDSQARTSRHNGDMIYTLLIQPLGKLVVCISKCMVHWFKNLCRQTDFQSTLVEEAWGGPEKGAEGGDANKELCCNWLRCQNKQCRLRSFSWPGFESCYFFWFLSSLTLVKVISDIFPLVLVFAIRVCLFADRKFKMLWTDL